MQSKVKSAARPVICGAFLLLTAAPAWAATNVSGSITTNTTWTLAGSPYIVTSYISIYNNATLTIEPGVEIRFNAGASLLVGSGSFSTGTLKAQGTA
ncbi:MAG: hypothetical protein HYY14_07020, partial [Candidatus Omnitrophica bacterium]|nr:hypothetical protein [Candidatus Omnitrophota bacterium]